MPRRRDFAGVPGQSPVDHGGLFAELPGQHGPARIHQEPGPRQEAEWVRSRFAAWARGARSVRNLACSDSMTGGMRYRRAFCKHEDLRMTV